MAREITDRGSTGKDVCPHCGRDETMISLHGHAADCQKNKG